MMSGEFCRRGHARDVTFLHSFVVSPARRKNARAQGRAYAKPLRYCLSVNVKHTLAHSDRQTFVQNKMRRPTHIIQPTHRSPCHFNISSGLTEAPSWASIARRRFHHFSVPEDREEQRCALSHRGSARAIMVCAATVGATVTRIRIPAP